MASESLKSLVAEARQDLRHITELPLAQGIYQDYNLVNTHLINRCQQEGNNSYLGLNSANALADHYLPVIFKLMYDLMEANIREYRPSLESVRKDQILIQKGVCKRLMEENGRFLLKSPMKHGFRLSPVRDADEIVSSHFITDAEYYSNRTSHKSLDEYDALVRDLFALDRCPPSFFNHKAIVVGTVKIIFEELRKYGLQHAFPHAVISRERDDYHGESLPLEPMLLFSSSYEAVREYLRNSGTNRIDRLVVLGDSQITKHLSSIKYDHYQGLLGGFHLIGASPLQRDNNMLIWNWTAAEERILLGRRSVALRYHKLPVSASFRDNLKRFSVLIRELGDEFGGIWMFRPLYQCLRGILADKLNLDPDFASSCELRIRDDFTSGLPSNYLDPEDAEAVAEEALPLLRSLFEEKQAGPDYLETVAAGRQAPLRMVVPRSMVIRWEAALAEKQLEGSEAISFGELVRRLNRGDHASEYILPYPINERHYELLSRVSLKLPVTIHLHLYEPELSLVREISGRYDTEARLSGGFKDARIHPVTEFGVLAPVRKERTEDLLTRLEENIGGGGESDAWENIGDHEAASARILAKAANQDQRELHCHLRIIRQEGETRQLVPVTELEPGDIILYYNNRNCDLLYNIIARESVSFRNVERDSLLWKTRLREYVGYGDRGGESGLSNRVGHLALDEDALSGLAILLDSRPQYMLDCWIKNLERVRFPRKRILDRLLNHLEANGLLSAAEKKGILQSRALFNSVMISLGQNLSGEVQSILLNTTDESLPDYIRSDVANRDGEYPILSRYEADVAHSIVRANVETYEFVSIIFGE